MTIALRPLRPVRPLLRKDADQLGLFGDVTPVKPTPKAKARAKLYGNVAAPVVPKPKAAPKPTATPGKKPKEGDTRTNRAGNKEVLRGGRWRLADNPQVIAKDKPAAIVPVVEDLREADLVDEALPDVPMADPEITLEDLQEPGEEVMGEAGEMAGEVGGNKTREDRLNSDGVILGSYFVNQDWSSDEPGAKIVQELKLRKLQSSDYVRYNDSLNSGDRFVLERRFVRMNDVNGRTLEDEWRPVLFGASEDNLIATTEVKKIDEIADSKVQELADLRIKAEAEAKAAERAKEEQKAKEYQEYLDWENSHVQAQYAATKGKKQKVTINLVSEGGNKIDPKEVDATVYGKLAVHKSLERFSPGYVVTHIPSGMAVYRTEDLRHAHRVATTFHNEINWPDDPSNLSEEDRLKAKNIEEAFATLKKPNHIDLKASPVIRKKESKAKKPTPEPTPEPMPEEAGEMAGEDAPVEAIVTEKDFSKAMTKEEKLALKMTSLRGVELKTDGIYYVPPSVMTDGRRRKLGLGWDSRWQGQIIEIKEWADVTGNPYDRGYAILDRRDRLRDIYENKPEMLKSWLEEYPQRFKTKTEPTLTKSLRPYPGPYLTLLGVRYILDGGILRKAGMSWEDFRCEAEAMHKEAQGDDDPCWKGYEAVGLKRKGKRMVPNCVPASR